MYYYFLSDTALSIGLLRRYGGKGGVGVMSGISILKLFGQSTVYASSFSLAIVT